MSGTGEAMAGFENQRFINAPPTLTLPVKADRLDTDKKEAVVKSIKTLKTAVAKLKELIELAKVDLTVLSDLIYKNHNRFRNDKGFRDHKIVKKLAIRVYTEVKLDTLLSQFLDNFPVAFDIKNLSVGGPPIYLPVSHMAEFVMVRLHGTAKLLLALIQVYSQTYQIFNCKCLIALREKKNCVQMTSIPDEHFYSGVRMLAPNPDRG